MWKEFCSCNRKRSALYVSSQMLSEYLTLDVCPLLECHMSKVKPLPALPNQYFSAFVQGTTVLLIFDLLFFFALYLHSQKY